MSRGAVLVLATAPDPGAVLLAAALEARGAPVRLLDGEALVASRWEHRLDGGPEGLRASTRLRLPTGDEVDEASLGLVVNRLRWLPVPAHLAGADAGYGAAEWNALVVSWLASLRCPVLDGVDARGLGRAADPRVTWLAMAAAAGLPTARVRLVGDLRRAGDPPGARESSDTDPWRAGKRLAPAARGPRPAILDDTAGAPTAQVLVAGSRWSAPPQVPPDVGHGCVRLAALAGHRVLEVAVATSGGRSLVSDVEPLPRLAGPGEAELVARLGIDLLAGAA